MRETIVTTSAFTLLIAAPFVGSFLGTLILRLPADRPIWFGRSRCDGCGRALSAARLIPLAGWVIARGRCRHCGERVSAFYPAVEFAAIGVAVWALAVAPGWLAWASAALGWSLLAAAVIDQRHMLLPDAITLPLVPAGLLVAWGIDPTRLFPHAVGAAAGLVGMLALRWGYGRLRGREVLGLGDAKLAAALGAWVSWSGLPSVLLWGAGTALAVQLVAAARGHRVTPDKAVAFGPYLALGGWLVWLYGPLEFAG